MSKYVPIIGLEVHIELETESKMFCECPADHFRAEPNSQTCPVCLGLPGAMPYANQKAIEYTLKLGSALGCKINKFSKFDRKHYFYPDLPKAFQTSQYDLPFCEQGSFKFSLDEEEHQVDITRIHLEEDTGKLVHRKVNGEMTSLIDFNRSGVPLLELVTEPDFSSTKQAVAFLRELQLIVRYLGISGADMEKGSMRLEANVSVAEDGWTDLPNFKVELKNINSFRFMEKAVDAEIRRMSELLQQGEKIIQETRGYDDHKDRTFSQRTKEEAKDYRYFPEPDLPPISISKELLEKVEKSLTVLPSEKRILYKKEYGLPENYTEVLVSDTDRAEYFERAVEIAQESKLKPKDIANFIINESLDDKHEKPEGLVNYLLAEMNKTTAGEEKTLTVVQEVIADNGQAVEEYKQGKKQVIGYLIGQVMQKLNGQGDPNLVKKILQEELGK